MPGATYEIRVAGLVPRALTRGLGDVTVCEHEMRTVLTASFADQAALYAFLERVRALHLELVEFRALESFEEQ